jgi:hypothetical protein
VNGQPPSAVPASQVSAVLAWAARLSAAPAGTTETAAYLTAKAAVLERIAAERAAGGRRRRPARRRRHHRHERGLTP